MRFLVMQKECFKCKVTKPLDEFYKHKQMGDGHLNKCKDCTKGDVAEHRARNIDKIRAYDRARGSRQSPDYLKGYRKRFPKKYKAHGIVSRAVRSGKMKRESECEECSSTFHVEAHHDDYDYPLTVRWLCSACHSQWHSTNGEGRNPF